MESHKATVGLANHMNFSTTSLEPPSDFYLQSYQKMSLNLFGFYSQKEACLAYKKGPFYMIREKRQRGRAALFFSLICLGNFTYGQASNEAEDGTHRARMRRGPERKTYTEFVFADSIKEDGQAPMLYYTTISQGFSFMTCYSEQTLSFEMLLRPFDIEVWIVIILSVLTIMVALVVVSIPHYNWMMCTAISFSHLFLISTMFERPTTVLRKLEVKTEFRVLTGIWVLVSIILTNAYLGLSITSISAPLESKSVTRFEQLAKPGCIWEDVKCHLDRIQVLDQYIYNVNYHIRVFWEKSQGSEAFWKDLYQEYGMVFPDDRNITLELVRNKSVRKFDVDKDYILLPYSIELNISKFVLSDNSFYSALRNFNKNTAKDILKKCTPRCTRIDVYDLVKLRLFDLLDPWHIPNPMVGNLSDMRQLKDSWDIELQLIQCGRTALILGEYELQWENRYFKKHYPWLKFFVAKNPMFKVESGWKFNTNGIAITPIIFRKLYVAGIVQLLDTWPHRVTSRRKNITKKVHSIMGIGKVDNPVKRISLDGSVQSIFWIYLILMITVALEYVVFEFNLLRCMWINLCWIFRLLKFKWKHVRNYVYRSKR